MRLIVDAKCAVRLRRGWAFEDSFSAICDDFRNRFMVQFEGEETHDHGGVSREWCFLLSHDFQPELRPFRVFGT